MANRLMEFLLRKKNTENGATDFAPLVKAEGANSAGIMPDGSFAQTPYVQPQPVIEHIQIDANGQPIPNAQYHPQRGGGLGTKLRYKAVNALFGQEPVNADTVNAQDIDNLGGTIQDNPRIGGVFNDFANGYRENRLNGFNVRNWGNNELPYDREKGLVYRIGEGVGTVGRTLSRGANAFGRGLRKVGQFAETPFGRGLIVGGLVLGTGGGALPALAFGGATSMGNQSNRMKDRAYRDSLINTAQQSRMGQSDWINLSPEQQQTEMQAIADKVNSYRGYMTDDVYRNMVDSQIAQENAAYRRMYYDTQKREAENANELKREMFNYQQKQDAIHNAQKWAEINNKGKDKGLTFNNVLSMGSHFDALPEVKNFKEIDRQFGNVEKTYNAYLKGEIKANAADQAMVTTLNKILDPTSVVRESEFARTAEGQSLLAKMEGYAKKMSKGGSGLTNNERLDLFNTMKLMYDASYTTYQNTVDVYTDMAKRYDINPADVIRYKPTRTPAQRTGVTKSGVKYEVIE